MSLVDLRQSIVDAIQTGIPSISGNCQAHGGRFDKGELKRLAVRTPAVLVACLAVSKAEEDGAGGYDLWPVMGAFVLVTDRPALPRDSGVLALVGALLTLIPENRWGHEDTGYPERIRAENLYSGPVDSVGLALWAITWEQKITMGSLDASTIDPFITFHGDWDLAVPDGAIDATDVVILPQDEEA